jgi:hypothetical protein
VLFFGFHWSFTILEPSGKGWPLPGTPAWYALIMAGLATITLSTSSVRAEDTTAQSSYPTKSENAISARRFQRVLVLRVNGRAAQDGDSMGIWLGGARISAICIGVAVSSDSYCPPDNTLTNR